MRKSCKFFLLSAIVLSLFFIVSCNNAIETGSLQVSVAGSGARGIVATSMDVSEYVVTVNDSNSNAVATRTVGASQAGAVNFTLPIGAYSVTVEAKNADHITIGNGQATVSISAGRTTSCTVEVNEISGTGTLAFSIACSDTAMAAKIYDAGMNLVETVALESNGTTYSGSASLDNGYYFFQVTFSNGAVADMETVRIIANQQVLFSGTYAADGIGGFVIVNNIIGTPSIEITTDKTNYLESDTQIAASAQISNLIGTSFRWYLDGAEVATSESTADAEIDITGLATGTHTLVLLVSNGSQVWSETKTFSICSSSFDGHYVGSRSDRNYWYFFDVQGDEITYSYYEGSLVEYETVPYRVEEEEDGALLIFKVSRRSYDYALFLPSNPEDYASRTYLYYEYGVDENGESINRGVYISLERKPNAVTWTEAGYEPYSDSYHVGLLESEYVTVRNNVREAHTLDENGVCTICGYDGHDYDIMDDASNVSEGSGRIYISRYWPGEFTLSDGTVVNDGTKFYVQRWSGYANYYALYYPASIYEAYEAGGGSASISSALSWYLRTYHSDFEVGSLWNVSDTKSFFENLFSLEWVEPSSDDVASSSNRRVVSSDVALISQDAERYMFAQYNQNMLELDDETPITEQNGIYFYNNGKYVTIYYPMIISEMYERAKGVNAESGNPFWAYIHIYFPNLNTAHENYEEMITTLVNGYVEPQLEDFLQYVHSY